ncbi:DUF4256 domain-containing protein [Defluviimonas sp. WL0002]|uniref:DUF4256 domain-containing protein n=1 Tax=Albidovulum marisflavi TaxID=2984159 RepID=A0ABT2ZDQ9_9RHOB|nr:DUF4256 domain-containing protein [Defluviimonas sp. WL0002]MCV2869249.1 DUF4256 domain-containing protein [Defluviimonas sp. WL0002]
MTTSPDEEMIRVLKDRFAMNQQRHPGLAWPEVEARLRGNPDKCRVLEEMERTGGEPDVVGRAGSDGALVFVDCAAESPAGRRSLCYDRKALDARRANKPRGAALELAAALGAELLTESQYRALQDLGEFDRKTSSWIQTPSAIRDRGGALFCDRRYGAVFTYHNGADSYYASRGFRTRLVV